MNPTLTKVFRKAPRGYIGIVEELPGANSQGETLKEARAILQEAIELVFEANRSMAEGRVEGRNVIRESALLCNRRDEGLTSSDIRKVRDRSGIPEGVGHDLAARRGARTLHKR